MDKANNTNTKEELLSLLEQFYPDPTLADDALKFLEKTATGSLKKIVQEAKELHEEKHGREISAGKNIAEEVQRYAEAGLGLPTSLRDMYRDITGNPREPIQLFQELSNKFAYKELRKVLAFLFHSLGSDLKAQGPSIPPGLLHRLLSGVRSLQGILGVYQFFRARMKLINFLFKREGLDLPKNLTFENISKQFVGLLQERYPTGEKILQMAGKLGIDKWILAKIIVFSQLRDAIRQIALSQFYRNVEHRDELYRAIIEALENLEEELDAIREEEEEAFERKEAGEEEEEKEEEKEEKDE
jgi:type III secretion protein W